MVYFKFGIGVKQVYGYFTFLVARIGGLFFGLFGQFLFEAAFTIAMHHGFIPVLAKVFCYVIFIGIILCYDHNLATGLKQNANEG